MDLLVQGLTLSLTGLAITFAALGLLILIILLLNRVFAAPHAPSVDTRPNGRRGSQPTSAALEPATVAAIAAALERANSTAHGGSALGAALTEGPGRWWRPRTNMAPAALPSDQQATEPR